MNTVAIRGWLLKKQNETDNVHWKQCCNRKRVSNQKYKE